MYYCIRQNWKHFQDTDLQNVAQGLVFVFTAFYIYEQMEEEIDGLALTLATFLTEDFPVHIRECIDMLIQWKNKRGI